MDVNCSNVNVSVNANDAVDEQNTEDGDSTAGPSRSGTELTNYLFQKLEKAESRLSAVEKSLEEKLQNQDIEMNKRIEKALKHAANKKRL